MCVCVCGAGGEVRNQILLVTWRGNESPFFILISLFTNSRSFLSG